MKVIDVLLPLGLLLLTVRANARTFTGGGADTNWTTDANWNPAGDPNSGDTLVFAAGANASNNNFSASTFHDLQFNARHTLTGNGFRLTHGIATAERVFGGVTVTPAITLENDQTFTARSSLVCGPILLNGRQLTVTGDGVLELDGLVSGAGVGSKVLKIGAGTLRVANSTTTTNSGGIAVSAGTLEVLGTAGAPVVLSGGRLTGNGIALGVSLTGPDVEIAPEGGNLTISGGLALTATTKVIVSLTGPGQASGVVVNGSLNLGNAELVIDASAYSPAWDEDFTIVTKTAAGAINGTFGGLPDDAEVPINATTVGRIHYDLGTGNDVVIDIISTTRTWDGGHVVNDDWNEAENWDLNRAPHFGDVLRFPAGIQSSDRGVDNDFQDDTTFRKLVFAGNDFTVRGAPFRLTHGIDLAAGVTANLDTDCFFVTNQAITFGDASTLHLDAADAIDITGRLVRLEGRGSVDGDITGDGEVTIGANADITYVARNTYDGITRIEAGGRLTIINDGVIETNPGSDDGSVIIGGTFEVRNQSTVTRFFIDELIHMQPGGRILLEGSTGVGGESVTELATNISLMGPGSMTISAPRGRNEISGLITGQGDLTIEHGVAEILLGGPNPSSFAGSLTVKGADLVAQKTAPGLPNISCGALTIIEDEFGGASVETRLDEQISDDCHVTVGSGGQLRIGNLTSRTETIGGLTIEGAASSAFQVLVTSGSLLAVRDAINVPAGTSDFPHGIAGGSLRIQGQPCVLNVAPHNPDPVGLFIASPVTRTAGASMRKMGEGIVRFGGTVSVPFELRAGEVLLNGNAVGSPVTLKGGTLGGIGSAGAITTSQPEGGAVSPGDGPGALGTLSAVSVALNTATTLKIDLLNATASSGHDVLVASGPVSLGGATLSLLARPGMTVPPGAKLVILRNDSSSATTGAFAGLLEGGFIPQAPGGWTITYLGGSGNDVELTRVDTGPGPATLDRMSIARGAGAGGTDRITLTGSAPAFATVKVEMSENLSVWTELSSVSADNAGVVTATIDLPASQLRRFFRFRR